MRHVLVAVMSLAALLMPPVRQACAHTCVEPAAEPVVDARVGEPTAECHKSSPPVAPKAHEQPASDTACSHDHGGTEKPGGRASIVPSNALALPPAIFVVTVHAVDVPLRAPGAIPRGSPPVRVLPLRI